MAFIKGDKSLTKENILSKVTSYMIFKKYCDRFEALGVKFPSEFRKDATPSCHIVMWKGDLLYKDFGERGGVRALDYVARKFDTDLYGALRIINRDFGLGLGTSREDTGDSPIIQENTMSDLAAYEKKNPTIIEIKPRRWTKADAEYWSRYGIPSRLLKYHNIKSIDYYRVSKNDYSYTVGVTPYRLAYSIDYYWNEGVFRRKLYFPQSKGRGRFISNVDETIVQGWTLLPKQGNILFITKSYKDILIFNLLGYWAIAPNNEMSYIPDIVMNKLKSRFKNIYVWFDNDEGGIEGGEQFASKFDLKATCNPLGEPKDPSDYVEKYSLKDFDLLVTKFLDEQ